MPTNVLYSPDSIEHCLKVEDVDKVILAVAQMNQGRFDNPEWPRTVRRFVLLQLLDYNRVELVVAYLLRSNLIEGV